MWHKPVDNLSGATEERRNLLRSLGKVKWGEKERGGEGFEKELLNYCLFIIAFITVQEYSRRAISINYHRSLFECVVKKLYSNIYTTNIRPPLNASRQKNRKSHLLKSCK